MLFRSEQALALSDGALLVVVEGDPPQEILLSARYACGRCNLSFEPPSPQLFSFNSPQGMCTTCDGLGRQLTFDPDLIVPDPSLSLRQGALQLVGSFREMGRWRRHLYEGLAETLGFSLDVPWKELPKFAVDALLHGAGSRHITYAWRSRGRIHYHGGTWEGVVPQLLAKYRKTNSPMHRAMYEKYMRVLLCPSCQGMRLNPQARSVRLAGRTLIQIEAEPVESLARIVETELPASLTPMEMQIAGEAVKEIRARLGFLLNVGLGYLSLDRSATTLSGGEAQRIRLAGQIGSGLVGVLYVLDEPSIGLHPRDNTRLLNTLARLRDQGNTVVVVEHDEETIRSADHIVDFGPGPGVRGGEVVAQGGLDEVLASPRSVTGRFLAGQERIEVPSPRRPVDPASKPSFPRDAAGTSKRRKPTVRNTTKGKK